MLSYSSGRALRACTTEAVRSAGAATGTQFSRAGASSSASRPWGAPGTGAARVGNASPIARENATGGIAEITTPTTSTQSSGCTSATSCSYQPSVSVPAWRVQQRVAIGPRPWRGRVGVEVGRDRDFGDAHAGGPVEAGARSDDVGQRAAVRFAQIRADSPGHEANLPCPGAGP
jgi:hypothetical protein